MCRAVLLLFMARTMSVLAYLNLIMKTLEQLESRARRTGERLLITVTGSWTSVRWSRGRGRRSITVATDDHASVAELLDILARRLPKEPQ
jgi:hypothetical protein